MFRLGCVTLIVLLFAIPAIAARYLPWWGVLLTIMAEVYVLANVMPKLLKYGFKRFALGLFLTKSRVLKGATIEVRDVRITPRPVRRRQAAEDASQPRAEVTAADGTVITTPVSPNALPDDSDDSDSDDEADSKNVRFVLVDFVLTPVSGSGKMQFYDPSELMLVPYGMKIKFDEDPTADGVSASAHDLTLIDESGAEVKDFDKLTGKSHLRVTFECPEALTGRVKFRYYFESFGDLTLP